MSKSKSTRPSLPAGDFSSWMRQTRSAQKTKNLGASVPCGDCTACCRSSLFIHIKPEETETLKHIPKNLLFPAPGLPEGNVLMGYDEKGRCPMFLDNKCSIYDVRPQTCRDFDCRVFTATGIEMDVHAQALIVERARQWQFAYPNQVDRMESSALMAAAKFLQEQRDLFPFKFLPRNPTQLALLAIKVFQVFYEMNQHRGIKEEIFSDAETAKKIIEALVRFESERPS